MTIFTLNWAKNRNFVIMRKCFLCQHYISPTQPTQFRNSVNEGEGVKILRILSTQLMNAPIRPNLKTFHFSCQMTFLLKIGLFGVKGMNIISHREKIIMLMLNLYPGKFPLCNAAIPSTKKTDMSFHQKSSFDILIQNDPMLVSCETCMNYE